MQASQAVIILLLVANLVATVWFGLNDEPVTIATQTQTEKTAEHELPAVITYEVRDRLYNRFVRAFNAKDYDALYDMFGPGAKAQFSKELANAEFQKLTKYFHSVEGGGFTYSELSGTQGNTKVYILNYAVTFPKSSELGTSGTLKITVAVQGGDYQVYGIRINAG
ncbi:hypothetical protein KOI40_03345 [Aestuariicella sp. G3-2]|uniref:hypothetical protein n=1 Tax=Pseudomaricurvus albidus TaxID=2842452 RepID=UPI001C0CB61D|nr:hypothetical protein [Aestuariicella albida]MBU3068838.1 hypothetical protein [Aestuariicella albida]